MKTTLVALFLSAFTASVAASNDPMVQEFKTLYAVQRGAPDVADILVAVNAKAAESCDTVSPIAQLATYEEVAAVADYVRMVGKFDGSEKLNGLLDTAANSVCERHAEAEMNTVDIW